MADEPAPEQAEKKNTRVFTLAIVLTVAVLEAVAFIVAIKFFGGGPSPSYGGSDGKHVVEAPSPPQDVGPTEVVLLQHFKVPNTKSGATIIYDIDISVVVSAPRKEKMEEVAKNRGAEISDRVGQIIRQASPRVLGEDDFGTLRLQLKQALSEVVGDDQVIQRVLIPRCVPLRAG